MSFDVNKMIDFCDGIINNEFAEKLAEVKDLENRMRSEYPAWCEQEKANQKEIKKQILKQKNSFWMWIYKLTRNLKVVLIVAALIFLVGLVGSADLLINFSIIFAGFFIVMNIVGHVGGFYEKGIDEIRRLEGEYNKRNDNNLPEFYYQVYDDKLDALLTPYWDECDKKALDYGFDPNMFERLTYDYVNVKAMLETGVITDQNELLDAYSYCYDGIIPSSTIAGILALPKVKDYNTFNFLMKEDPFVVNKVFEYANMFQDQELVDLIHRAKLEHHSEVQTQESKKQTEEAIKTRQEQERMRAEQAAHNSAVRSQNERMIKEQRRTADNSKLAAKEVERLRIWGR